MSAREPRYELLPSEEDEPATPVGASATVAVEDETTEPSPAPVASATSEQGENAEAVAGDGILGPPSYSVATNLPSYEEAEASKAEEEARRDSEAQQQPSQEDQVHSNLLTRLLSRRTSREASHADSQLGTDGMFLCTFLFAFVFNWIGLLGSLCITQTIAGRLGAMSGFGLSLVKWVAIVKHSTWAEGITQGDSWLWWLLIVMGFLIFLRGCTQYIRIKFYWAQLSQNVRNNIFYYF